MHRPELVKGVNVEVFFKVTPQVRQIKCASICTVQYYDYDVERFVLDSLIIYPSRGKEKYVSPVLFCQYLLKEVWH